eukprot:12711861-Alexandrium_andersonii.AAC.1
MQTRPPSQSSWTCWGTGRGSGSGFSRWPCDRSAARTMAPDCGWHQCPLRRLRPASSGRTGPFPRG